MGEFISRRIEADGWGKSTITSLASYIWSTHLNLRGFSAQNLWRMRQFYETYRDEPKLSPLVRELPWTHNLLILSRSKRPEEREFYLLSQSALLDENVRPGSKSTKRKPTIRNS